MRKYILCLISVLLAASSISATIIHIPTDYPTIQQGIDASYDGDTVLVQPGTYVENINFDGHNIVLGSLFLTTGDMAYISQTVIDGDSSGSVVTFENGEDSTAVIIGFTIRNGYALLGGGIFSHTSDPTISNNYITNNSTHGMYEDYGGGIYCFNSSSYITGNFIFENTACFGGGIFSDSSSPIIYHNIIIQNYADY